MQRRKTWHQRVRLQRHIRVTHFLLLDIYTQKPISDSIQNQLDHLLKNRTTTFLKATASENQRYISYFCFLSLYLIWWIFLEFLVFLIDLKFWVSYDLLFFCWLDFFFYWFRFYLVNQTESWIHVSMVNRRSKKRKRLQLVLFVLLELRIVNSRNKTKALCYKKKKMNKNN